MVLDEVLFLYNQTSFQSAVDFSSRFCVRPFYYKVICSIEPTILIGDMRLIIYYSTIYFYAIIIFICILTNFNWIYIPSPEFLVK